jgi:GT2 family glycosyltransferase/lipopolysaccharide/colanic/teichoic acid biosynthesis glycosyltransferase
MSENPKISVIIVNYNVRDFIMHALQSIKRALADIPSEIIVVDNASVDGSVEMISNHFPKVILIQNDKNVGFAAANNMALKQSKGEFIVLINPDTIVQEDTFTSLIAFMKQTPQAGAATCKILNPDGTFSLDCRHSIPTPMTAFWKLIGFSRLFPKSKIFGRYNLTFLDIDKTYTVDAISGSFMFIRRRVLEQVGYLDEDFFMYCEDIDYCYRINKYGWKIYYLPESSIIHYKGESTRKKNLDYVINFNRSLYIFYKKHFQQKSITAIRWLILLGVFFRAVFVYIKNFVGSNFVLITDLIVLNLVIFLTFVIRYELKSSFLVTTFFNLYIVINILATFLFLGVGFFLDLYGRYKFSLIQIVKTNAVTFFIIAALTFFLKQFAFSRVVVVISAFFSTLFMILLRTIIRKYWRTIPNTLSRSIFQKRTLVVGTDENTQILIKKLKNHVQVGYDLLGLVSLDGSAIGKTINGVKVVCSIDKLHDYIKLEKITQVIFSTHNISYETIIKTMSRLDNSKVTFKIAPENLEVIIGKSIVERLTDYPLLDIEYAIGKSFNRITKRIFDVIASSIILLLTLPFWSLDLLFNPKQKIKIQIWGDKGRPLTFDQNKQQPFNGFLNNLLLILNIFLGKISFVGAPFRKVKDPQPTYFYKPGLTGLVQINQDKIYNPDENEVYDLFYLKNQSFWLDLEIIIKAFFGGGKKKN